MQDIIREKNTLFDDISKNLENDDNLYKLIYDILIVGEQRLYSINNPTIDMAVTYGIVKDSGRNLVISNQIFEQMLCDYFISKNEETGRRTSGVLQYDIVSNGRFDMELCLRKFAEHYAEIYSASEISFFERHGRMLFLSYLKPLINGQGFYHIESQLTDLRRMDLVVDFGRQQFIIELKIWRGEQYQNEAYQQLSAYLDSKNKDEGYLLAFDFRKEAHKTRPVGWVEKNGKRIFEVIV